MGDVGEATKVDDERESAGDRIPVVELSEITKTFGGVRALSSVGLSLYPGEVLGLLGENGAGKSTLVKILTGVVQPDSGEIRIDGERHRLHSPRVARDLGIAATYQEPMVLPDLDVAENVFAGRQPVSRGLVDWRSVYRQTKEVLATLGIALDARTPVYTLGIADRQLIEIAKALSSGARVLILDEPTAVLSSREIEALFTLVKSLKARGIAIVFISHKLDEIAELTDRVVILRDGRRIAEGPTRDLSTAEMIQMMVGRQIDQMYPEPSRSFGDVVLEVEGLTKRGYFQDVSFRVARGEILGLAGLVGAGRTEVAEALFGILPFDSGTIRLAGLPYVPKSPRQAIRCGLAYLPENRLANGLVSGMRVPLNLTMSTWDTLSRGLGLFRTRVMYRRARDLAARVELQAGRLDQLANTLSGGNQQKVVLGKWLATEPQVLILDEPTHGIDVGTKSEVLHLIAALAATGVAIILISSELEEVRAMSTRLIVMRAGRIAGEFETPVDPSVVLEAATGAAPAKENELS